MILARALPWRAYLSRYGRRVPLVVIIGDPKAEGLTEPSALALDGTTHWRLASRGPVRARLEDATMAVYVRTEEEAAADDGAAAAAGDVSAEAGARTVDDDTWRGADKHVLSAQEERPRLAPSYRVNFTLENFLKHGLPLC